MGVFDLADESLAEFAGCFVVQAKVRVFLHDVERVAKVRDKVGF
jgi:hypothetical protein